MKEANDQTQQAVNAQQAQRALTRADGGKDATRKLARHAAALRYEQLPKALVERLKQTILDCLGTGVAAGTLAAEGKIIVDYVRGLGGRPESTIIGFGGRAPAAWAAFANGSLFHMLDYDDVGEHTHFAVATVPVAFAVAEQIGKVSGRDFIAAVASGTDVLARIAKALSFEIPVDWTLTEGWFATQLFGYLSGAATAGRLLALDADQMENAFGIGFNQFSGSRQMAVGAATHMRSMQAGFSGQGGVLAAELAQRGIIGSKEILEGRYGVFRTYLRDIEANWDIIVGGLGTRYPLLDIQGFKIWPACRQIHPTLAATMHLRNDHQLSGGDIEDVNVISPPGGKVQFLSEPIALKRRPKMSIDGKYSIPFTLAVMLARGNVTVRDYTESGLRDPAVLAIADRVRYSPAAATHQFTAAAAAIGQAIVEIRTRDGRKLVREAIAVPGDPANPVDSALLEAKFRDCVSFSVKPVPAANVERVIESVRNLESVADAGELIRLLS